LKSSRISEWLTLFANVAVVVGIIFLAIEVSQNTAMIEAQMSQGRAETAMDQAESLYNSDYLPEIFLVMEQEQPLTDLQRVRFTAYLRAFNRNQDNLLHQVEQGFLGAATLRSIRDAVWAEIARNKAAREIWENTKVSYSDEYVALVDSVISEHLSKPPSNE
jgi:hypothetical protein